MWVYAAAVLGGLLLIVGLTRRHASRKRNADALDVGRLSDAWLAEQRGKHEE